MQDNLVSLLLVQIFVHCFCYVSYACILMCGSYIPKTILSSLLYGSIFCFMPLKDCELKKRTCLLVPKGKYSTYCVILKVLRLRETVLNLLRENSHSRTE